MKRNKSTYSVRWLGILVLTYALPVSAHAQGWYAGIGFGSSDMKDASTALLGNSFEDSDSGWKLFVGSKFNPNAALEFSYVDFGTFQGKNGSTVVDTWEASAFNFSLLGIAPFGSEFSIFGKVGFASWNVDDTFLGVSASASGTGISYGVGMQYDFNKQFGLRAEWEQFGSVGEQNTTGESDLSLLTLSAVLRF